MINITSAEGVVTIVITDKDAHDLQLDVQRINDDNIFLSLDNPIDKSHTFRMLKDMIIKHV